MKVSEQIAVMKAYENGKTIEQKRFDRNEWESIVYAENFPFDFLSNEYRIKPEDKYRHFQTIDEAFNEAKKHGFFVKCKNKESLCTIHDFGCGICGDVYINGYDALKFLNDFVWLDDGSPCGVKIG